jgi:hypothetical protein
VSNPKTEVKELVNSFTQRRYQQLEESDESHESRNDSAGSQISDSDIENCVFHRVDDVHQNNKQKPAKPKKAKKVQFLALWCLVHVQKTNKTQFHLASLLLNKQYK